MTKTPRRIRVFRYSFMNFPGYYIITLFVGGILKVFVPGIPDILIYTAMAATLLPHWRAFIYFGQVGAIISPRRVFIRGVTPKFGVLRRNLVFLDLIRPISNPFLRFTKVTYIANSPRTSGRTLGYFSSDDFSFQSIRWLGNV